MPDHFCTELDFIRGIAPRTRSLIWFLGAGASRAAGMPTASDIIWDLKRRYYCLHENQDLQAHNVNNQAVRTKLQNYMDSKGFPSLSAPGEYSFYFELTFGADLAAQQRYIAEQLNPDKISINIGNRVLAALLAAGLSRIVFTPNFDEVLERAYAFVSGESLAAFHLEGSYAALDALNAEQYPLYAKVHGDFRYRSLRNLSADLQRNDAEVQKCFLAASNRYGMIVAGYSGRDSNVMQMFNTAMEQANAFPHGMYWTTPRAADAPKPVLDLVLGARSKGISAFIVETGTFDTMMTKIWRHLPEKSAALDQKVYTATAASVAIPLPPPGRGFPLIRTNGLSVTRYPTRCGKAITETALTFQEISDRRKEKKPDAVVTFTGQALFWGSTDEIEQLFQSARVKAVEHHDFDDVITSIASSGAIKSFFEEALVRALCHAKPVVIRRRDKTWYAVAAHSEAASSLLLPIRRAVGYRNQPAPISGPVPKLANAFWAECVSIKLEERNGALWLLIRPDIWITPMTMRDQAAIYLRDRKLRRWNAQSFAILDAWIGVLLGSVGAAQEATVTCFYNTNYPVAFTVNTRSAYSGRGGTRG